MICLSLSKDHLEKLKQEHLHPFWRVRHFLYSGCVLKHKRKRMDINTTQPYLIPQTYEREQILQITDMENFLWLDASLCSRPFSHRSHARNERLYSVHKDKRETVKLSAMRSPWCPLHLAKLAGPRGASACGQCAACVSLLNSPPAHQVRGRDDPNKGPKKETVQTIM